MSIFEFSQSIKSLNTEKKFQESLKFFKNNKTVFTPQQIGLNKYVVSEVITALIETNNYDAIFIFIEQHNAVLEPKEFSFLLKRFKDKPSVNWNVVCKFCDLVSVESLDTECKTIEVERKGVKKSMELASNKENWYAFKTKSLFETQQYQECFELSKKGLELFEKLHYSNEVWFARRIALSKKHLGNSTDALNELLEILKRKKEWFIQNEIATIYMENGDLDKSFKYAIEAVNNFGDLEFKVKLLDLIAEILDKKGEKELAFKHYMFSKILRQVEQWNVPHGIDSALNYLGYPQIPINELPTLKHELKNYWNTLKPQKMEQKGNNNLKQIGKIEKILHNDEVKGADGFIKYDVNKSVYFRVYETDDLRQILKVGLEVKFKIIPPKEDGKKERAIQLKLNDQTRTLDSERR